MFISKSSGEVLDALRVASASIIDFFSDCLPFIIYQKLVYTAAERQGTFKETTVGMMILIKLYQIITAIYTAFSRGLQAPASFSYGANRMRRMLDLTIDAIACGTIWGVIWSIILSVFPRQLMKFWTSDPSVIDQGDKMLSIAYLGSWMNMLQFATSVLLQTMKRVGASIAMSLICLFFPLPVFSLIMYLAKNNDPVLLVWALPANDVWSFCICVIYWIAQLRFLFKMQVTEGEP